MQEQKSTYVRNDACDKCGSSDAVGIYKREDGTHYGRCFKCETFFPNIDNDSNEPYIPKAEAKIDFSSADYHDLYTRGIDRTICEEYGVKSVVDNGVDIAHMYPFTDHDNKLIYSIRKVGNKEFVWLRNGSTNKKVKLFHQDSISKGGKLLIITEGVCDAMAAKQMLLEQGKNYRVTSLPNGASSAMNSIRDNFEWVNSFDTVILCFDMDEPGQEAVEKVGMLFTANKCKVMKLPMKDANEMLKEGMAREFLSAVFDAQVIKAEGIVSVDELIEEALAEPPPSISYPWRKMNELLLGYRRKELILIGAAPGAGKSQFIKEIATHLIFGEGIPVGLVFLEESPVHTLKSIASISANKRFTLPKEHGKWSDEELRAELTNLRDKIYMFKHFGAKGFDEIKAKVTFMAVVLGIKDIFIDHITALVAAENDEYRALNRISEELASLAFDLDITIFLVSHLRKNNTGKSFSEGAPINTDSFKGSGSLISWAHLILALSRNQSADDEVERNTTVMSILKSRFIGEAVGHKLSFFYDKTTGRMLEAEDATFSQFDDEEEF